MLAICVATVLYMVFAVAFMRERMKGYSKKDVTLKVLASLWFLAIMLMALGMNPSVMGILLLIGGISGALGDLFLGLSHIDKEKKREFMLLGFMGFGMGHVFYCAGIVSGFSLKSSLIYLLVPLLIGVLASSFIGIFGRKMGLHFGRFLPVVVIYVFLLTFSVALSLSLNIMTAWENAQLKIFTVGILLFIVSDSILSKMYFGKQKHPSLNVVTNHVTYYLAQWFIALSILFS